MEVIGNLKLKRELRGNEHIFYCVLPEFELERIRNEWIPDWSNANQPWGYLNDGTPIHRCNALLLVYGPLELEGTRITTENRRK